MINRINDECVEIYEIIRSVNKEYKKVEDKIEQFKNGDIMVRKELFIMSKLE